MDALWSVETSLTLFFQSLGVWLQAPMNALSFLGTQQFYMLVLPVLYWCIDAATGLRVGAILLLTGAINTDLKLIFRGPRPFWYSPQVQAFSSETSFGIPSGHAQNSACVWGQGAASARRRWAAWAAGGLVFFIGLSRIYLGMHFTSDVLVGWAIGVLILIAFLRWERPVRTWFLRRSGRAQAGLIVLSALAITGVELLIHAAVAGYQLPADWLANAVRAVPFAPPDPLAFEDAFTLGGVWLGLVGGAAWLYRAAGGFSAAGSLTQRAARYLLGLVGVFVLWYGLDRIFPAGGDALSLSLRFARYALVGAWISALAPLTFIRLGLAQAGGGPATTADSRNMSSSGGDHA